MSPREMQTFVITFSRLGIRDGWVEVEAYDESIARTWALREYGPVWSGIYTMDDHDRAYYPLGCFGRTTLHYEAASHV